MTPIPLPDCRHRGPQFSPGRWSCYSPKLILPLGTDHAICVRCPYPDHPDQEERIPSGHVPEGDFLKHGVAIGTYDSLHAGHRYGVDAVRLNLKVLRARCGPDIPVLVCDDGSPPESQRKYRSVCAESGAEFTSNSKRWGHTSGDMVVFYKALKWARERGLQTVTKLSHRLVIDAPRWIQDDATQLLLSGHSTYAQMLSNFPTDQIRTEGVMMVVRTWAIPEVFEHFSPRKLSTWNEGHTFQAILRYVDRHQPYPGFLPWARLSCVRGHDKPPVFFRDMKGDPDRHFQEISRRYGIPLPPNFSTADSILSDDYVS